VANKITVIFDLVAEKAKAELKSFKTELKETEGIVNKAKLGVSSGLDMVKKNAVGFAAVGGAALFEFGVKSLEAFENTAKAALDTGKAIGTSTENASRWIAVGEEYEVGADKIVAGASRIVKSLDAPAWQKYGIATRDAGGHARDTSDILVDALSTLSELPTASQRAEAGTELMGKGFKNLAPLLGHTKEQYKEMLGAVGDGRVITDQEAEKAERMRIAQKQLGEALKDIVIAFGGFVASAAPAVEKLTQMVELSGKLMGILTESGVAWANTISGVKELTNTEFVQWLQDSGVGVDEIRQRLLDLKVPADEVDKIMGKLGLTTSDTKDSMSETDTETRRLSGSMKTLTGDTGDTERETRRLKGAMGEAATSVNFLEVQYDNLMNKLHGKQDWETAKKAVDEFKFKVAEGKTPIAELGEELTSVQITLGDYVHGLTDVPDFIKSEVLTEIDNGDVIHAEAVLEILARDRHVKYFVDQPITSPGFGGAQGRTVLGLMRSLRASGLLQRKHGSPPAAPHQCRTTTRVASSPARWAHLEQPSCTAAKRSATPAKRLHSGAPAV
jgi:methyl-accepting chemotaxis protein